MGNAIIVYGFGGGGDELAEDVTRLPTAEAADAVPEDMTLTAENAPDVRTFAAVMKPSTSAL